MLECEYDFQNYGRYVCLKSELLDPKIEKSPTYCDFENFDPHPHLRSNFKTHKNVGGNFLLSIYVGIYLIYIHTNYEEN